MSSPLAEWSDAQTEQLRTLAGDGHSYGHIAIIMGLSKNSVVGKANRMKLPARPSPIGKSGPRIGRRPPRPIATLPPLTSAPRLTPIQLAAFGRNPPKPPEVPAVEQLHLVLRVAPPLSRRCAFPLWPHDQRPPRPPRFCDAPATRGSYCERCARICYGRADTVAA